MFSRLLLLLLPLVALASSNTKENVPEANGGGNKIIKQAVKDFVAHQKRTLLANGEEGDRCGRFSKCNDGLSCVGGVVKTCVNAACLAAAFQAEFGGENYDLNAYWANILTNAGLGATDGQGRRQRQMYNDTTVALGGDAIFANNGELVQYVILPDVQNAIVAAMLADPVPLDGIEDRAAACTKQTRSGIGYMAGGHLEAKVGFGVWGDIYYARGNNDTIGGVFGDVCFGAGPKLGIESSGTAGVIFGGTKNDLVGPSVMFDADIELGFALGFAAGANLINGVPILEFTFGVGIGGGFGINYCLTHQFSEQ